MDLERRDSGEEATFCFTRPAWQQKAACRPDVIPHVWQEFAPNPNAFFFPPGRNIPKRWKEAIKEICGSCPVRAECREHAILHEEHGRWAAMTRNDLYNARRERGITLKTPEVDPGSHKTIGTFYPPTHGSEARYLKHLRDGDTPCERCTLAANEAKDERRPYDPVLRKRHGRNTPR